MLNKDDIYGMALLNARAVLDGFDTLTPDIVAGVAYDWNVSANDLMAAWYADDGDENDNTDT